MLAIGGLIVWGPTGAVMLAAGAGLGSLAGLELSIREHLAGYRSHTVLLSGGMAVAVLAGSFFAGAPRAVTLIAAAVVFAAGVFALRELFKRRSGGLSFR